MSAAAMAAVLDALNEELSALRHVDETLTAEHKALLDVTPGDLEQAILDKNTALTALAQRRVAREALTGTGSLVEFLNRQTPTAEGLQQARELVDALRSLGTECQQKNQRNGRLIGGLKDSTEGALGVLRAGEASVTLYGQDGDRSSDLGSRILGTA
jgi:flagellar biosynthesis/type III secretory pathway chaperone